MKHFTEVNFSMPPIKMKPLRTPKWPTASHRRPMADPDRDGYPSAIDCHPRDPNRQGFLGDVVGATKEAVVEKVSGKLKETRFAGAVEKYESYKSRAPERRQQRYEEQKAEDDLDELSEQRKRSKLDTEKKRAEVSLVQSRSRLSSAKMNRVQQRTRTAVRRGRAATGPMSFGSIPRSLSPRTPFGRTPKLRRR